MTRTQFVAMGGALGIIAACSEQGFTPHQEPEDAGGPDIQVTPTLLQYQTLSDGEEEVQTFSVSNVGTAELHLSDIELTGSESFMLLSSDTDVAIPPGAHNEFDVLFTPKQANENFGSAIVYSDDPDDPQVTVDLIGLGAVPELQIEPDPYDFGIDYVGCGYGHEFMLSNVGTDPLIISDIAYSNADGQLTMAELEVEFPLRLQPEENTAVWVDFMPATEGVTTGTIEVTSNDPRGVVSSEHTGEGVYGDWNSEIFQVPVNPPVDIVFAVDRSCSMEDDAISLASNFAAFIGDIDTVTSGWQIGVVTRDDGCFNARLDSSTPNYESLFASAATSNAWGMWTEALLTVSRNALAAASGGCNNGFLRPGAMTHVIMLSDEPEQSVGSWSDYVTAMQASVSDPSMLKLSAIAGDYPGGCGTADPGTGYYEAVNATGGEFLSICSNWASNVEVLAAASLEGLFDFTLSLTPDPATIVVTVDGSQWLADWHYDAGTNSIVFDVELAQGATVVVDYGVLVACD